MVSRGGRGGRGDDFQWTGITIFMPSLPFDFITVYSTAVTYTSKFFSVLSLYPFACSFHFHTLYLNVLLFSAFLILILLGCWMSSFCHGGHTAVENIQFLCDAMARPWCLLFFLATFSKHILMLSLVAPHRCTVEMSQVIFILVCARVRGVINLL